MINMIQRNTARDPQPLKWIPVLMYHRVVEDFSAPDPNFINISIADFESQMAYLSERGYQAISLDDVPMAVSDHSTWKNPVAITFDDGYQDTYTHALPILKKYGLIATVMLVSDCIGGRNTWDVGKAESAQLLSIDEIRTLAQSDMHFGAHGATHSSLPDLSVAEARNELARSKAALESLLGHEIATLAYPYGRSNPEICRIAETLGFVAAFGVDQSVHTLHNFSRIDAARCKGATLMWHLKVSGAYHRLRQIRSLRMLYDLHLRLHGQTPRCTPASAAL